MKHLARWISIVAHPFAMIALLVAVPAMRQSSGHAVQSVLLVALIVIPIAVLMFRQVRCGRWSNVDASNPSERPVLFVVALAGLLLRLVGYVLRTRIGSSSRACSSLRRSCTRCSPHSLGQTLAARRVYCSDRHDLVPTRFVGRLCAHRRGSTSRLVAHRPCTSPRSRGNRWAGARHPHRSCACPALTSICIVA
jgi:hypothetical protein